MDVAGQLEGIDLGNGWTVGKLVPKGVNATGGHFSFGYHCSHQNGTKGFLKALNYAWALSHPNRPEILNAMTATYLFERDLYEKCSTRKLSRVSRCIQSGSVVAGTKGHPNVDYLIFELANCDIRHHLDAAAISDTAFVLRTLHHIATGLRQLHSAQIAHQDLKPSNVLVFPNGAGSKIGDLGRSWSADQTAPHDGAPIAGDRNYAPIENGYGLIHSDPLLKRFGCDMYQLGNLACFLFTRSTIHALITKNLAPEHRPVLWAGTYDEVLPFLEPAFELALDEIGSDVPLLVRSDVRQVISEFCQPDYRHRGHGLSRLDKSNPYSLERYVSLFDLLAYKCETSLAKGNR